MIYFAYTISLAKIFQIICIYNDFFIFLLIIRCIFALFFIIYLQLLNIHGFTFVVSVFWPIILIADDYMIVVVVIVISSIHHVDSIAQFIRIMIIQICPLLHNLFLMILTLLFLVQLFRIVFRGFVLSTQYMMYGCALLRYLMVLVYY